MESRRRIVDPVAMEKGAQIRGGAPVMDSTWEGLKWIVEVGAMPVVRGIRLVWLDDWRI